MCPYLRHKEALIKEAVERKMKINKGQTRRRENKQRMIPSNKDDKLGFSHKYVVIVDE